MTKMCHFKNRACCYYVTIVVFIIGTVNITTIGYQINKRSSSHSSSSLEVHFLRGPLHKATAAASHRMDTVTATTQRIIIDDEPVTTSCGLYIAPSTLPHANLGLFAGREFSEDVAVGPADIMIPVGYNERSDNGVMIDAYGWSDWTLGFAAKALPSLQEEGSSAKSMILGHGLIANCIHGLANIDYSTVIHDANLGTGPFPLEGSFTPYHGIKAKSTRKIDAFSEIFLSYCEDKSSFQKEYENILVLDQLLDDYFKVTDGKPIISENFAQSLLLLIQERQEFNTSDTPLIVGPILELLSGTTVGEGFKKDLWRIIRKTLDPVSRDKFPSNPKELESIRSSGGLLKFLNKQHTRSKKWLANNGLCVDYLRMGGSTILEAGRGVFSRISLTKDSIITPCPLIQMHHKVLEKKVVRKHSSSGHVEVRQTDKLILNYCFGHEKSSVRLCPYGSASHLINHSIEKANAKIRWSISPMMNSSRLMLSTEDLLSMKTPANLLFDIVATRDILPGEEIFMDYGPAWQNSWNQYQEEWNAAFGWSSSNHSGADVLLHADQLITADPSLRTACWYNFEDATAATHAPQEQEQHLYFTGLNSTQVPILFDWVYTSPPTWTLGGLYPCDLITHETDTSGHTWFTAKIGPFQNKPNFDSRVVQMIPRHAIVLVNEKWGETERKKTAPPPFRQYIGIPDEIFPQTWIDL